MRHRAKLTGWSIGLTFLAASAAAQEVPAPQGLVCRRAYSHLHELSWENAAAYDSITVTRQVEGQSSNEGTLPGDATSALVTDYTGAEPLPRTTFEVRGVVGGTASAPAACEAADEVRLPFIRGDANRDGTVSISDVATMERALFVYRWDGILLHGSLPPCVEAADSNDDDRFDITDSVNILKALYYSGPIFPEPFPLPAIDDRPGSHSCIEPQGPAPLLDEAFVLEVGTAEGSPGDLITLPVRATTPVEVDAFSLALRFDPEKLAIEDITFEGTVYETLPLNPVEQGGFKRLDPGAGPGLATVGIINSFIKDVRLPPLDGAVLLGLRVRVREDAEPGLVRIVPRSTSGPLPVHNEISVLGEAVYAATYPILLEGALRIGLPGNEDYFRRGDSNGDGKVDITDAVTTLGFLFLGQARPACRDAADADDDGQLLITDPIALLGHLFLGSASVAPPYPDCGADPTDDGLGCARPACP